MLAHVCKLTCQYHRGSFIVGGEYRRQDVVKQVDRDWAFPAISSLNSGGANNGSFFSPDGNTILVPGYYDGILPPNEEESLLINAGIEQRDDVRMQEMLGVSRWIDDKMGSDAVIEFLYQPTLNIDGIWGGYRLAR